MREVNHYLERLGRQERFLEIRRKEGERLFQMHHRRTVEKQRKVRLVENRFNKSLEQARQILQLQGDESRTEVKQKIYLGRKGFLFSGELKEKLTAESNSLQVCIGRKNTVAKQVRSLTKRTEVIRGTVQRQKALTELKKSRLEQEDVLEILSVSKNSLIEKLYSSGDAGDLTEVKSRCADSVLQVGEEVDQLLGEPSDASGSENYRSAIDPDQSELETYGEQVADEGSFQSADEYIGEKEAAHPHRLETALDIDKPSASHQPDTKVYHCSDFQQMYSRLRNLLWWNGRDIHGVSFLYKSTEETCISVHIEHDAHSGLSVRIHAASSALEQELSRVVRLIEHQMKVSNLKMKALIVNGKERGRR